jgi:CheY-like chemotaxis protein
MARVLLIDDDVDVRTALATWLRRHGHDVVEAGDGGEGLERLEAAAFDIVVTDIIMPDVEGIETIMRIRKAYPTMPVIAISGGGSGEPSHTLRPASRLGAHATLRKPFRPSVLGETIDRLLRGDGASET